MLKLGIGMPTQCLDIHIDVYKLFWIVETFQHVYHIIKKASLPYETYHEKWYVS